MTVLARAVVAAALVLALSGCQPGEVVEEGLVVAGAASEPASDRATTAPTDAVPEAGPGTPPDAGSGSGDARDPHGDLACDAATLAAIDGTIDGQITAIADGDFAAAREYASSAFKAGIDVEQFRAIIEEGFPVVAGATEHTSDVCVAQGDSAQILVAVSDAEGAEQELVYSMTRESGAWRIDGAAPAGQGGAPGTGGTVEV